MKSSRVGESMIWQDVEVWPRILISSAIIGTGMSACICKRIRRACEKQALEQVTENLMQFANSGSK
jgi:hypothetical protein